MTNMTNTTTSSKTDMTNTTPKTKKMDRQVYQQELKAKIEKLNAQIDEINAKARQESAEKRLSSQNYLEELATQRDQLMKEWDSFLRSNEAAFEELQIGLEKTWNQVVATLEKIQQHYK